MERRTFLKIGAGMVCGLTAGCNENGTFSGGNRDFKISLAQWSFHKKLFAKEGPVPEGDYTIPLGQAAVKRQGNDVTLLCYGSGFYLCEEAAGELSRNNIEAEIVDLRTLKPLDMHTISESIKKTNRAVIVHEACLTGGFGAELAARIQEELFDYLKAPVKRVAAKDVPMPFSPSLEDYVLPKVPDVVEAVRSIVCR